MIFPIFISPFLTTLFREDDKQFSEAICKDEKEALKEFQDLYSDELYFIAAKFNNGGIPEDFWEYRTKKGYSIKVSNDVSACYLWLIRVVKNRSCKYEGYNGATFKTFIMSSLNNSNRKTDWIRHQTGITNYIPKCIRNLEQVHQDVFKMLQQKKTDTDIQRKLNLNTIEYLTVYSEVELALINAGELRLLNEPKFIAIDTPTDDETDDQPTQVESVEFVDPENIPDIEIVKDILIKTIDTLTEAERRLLRLYWGEGQSVDQIYDTFSFFPDYLEELGMMNSSGIYPIINKLVKKLFKKMSDIFPDEVDNYQLTSKKLKPLIKEYLYYFDDFE